MGQITTDHLWVLLEGLKVPQQSSGSGSFKQNPDSGLLLSSFLLGAVEAGGVGGGGFQSVLTVC